MDKKTSITVIAVILMTLWTCANVQAEAPDVSFYWPTPDDGATVTEPSVQIKAIITEPDLADAAFQWEGVDYTVYDSSLALMFNFNNVEGLGEDYGSLSPVVDVSGAGNHGQLGGAAGVPVWMESEGYEGAFEFYGAESILVPHNPDGSLDPGSGDFAVVLWILTPENIDADIMRKGSTGTTDGMWYKLEHSAGSANKISLNFNTNATDATIYSTNSYADSYWHFVVAQRKGDQAELWVDGVLNGTAAVTGDIYNEANLTLGSKDTQNDDFFNGMLDEVRIWMRSFIADEIQLLYDSNLSKYKSLSGPTEWTLNVKRESLVDGAYAYGVSATNGSAETDSKQRTVTVALPAPPDVTLVSPADGSILNNTTVTFTVDAVDPVGLFDATLYVGTPEQIATFSGPTETDDAQIYETDDSSTGTVEGPETNAGDAVNINVDGLNPHAHAVIKFPNLIGSGAGQVPSNTAIVSATLQVNCTNLGAMMQVYRLTSDWSETTVTWNSPWTSPGGDYDDTVVVAGDCTATGLRTIDITEFVQAWSDGTANCGILLTDTGTDGVDFDSSEGGNAPLLTVVYAGDWQSVQTQPLSGTSGTATFTNVQLADETDYVWNCLVTNAADPPMSSWAASNFSLSIDGQTPDEPVLVGPADGATDVTVPVTLEVTVSDPQTSDVLDVAFYGRKKVSGPEDFTIVVLPDTQKYAQSYPDIFTSQTEWIIANKEALNIVFVTHEGDIVNTWNSITEWDRANTSMSLLDGVVPYSVVPGDHDHYGEDPPGSTEYYEQYFPALRFTGYSWWGGSYAGNYGGDYNEDYPHTNNNNYQLLKIGGEDYIFLSLDFCPSQDEIDWANGVLTTYSDRRAILTTHALLDTGANYSGSGDFWLYPDGTSNPTGDTSLIWYDLIRNHENLELVLCGHMHGEARRTDDNLFGKPVHQLLANYQGRANGGDGWLRTMRFVPAENKVYVETYSPWRDEYETDGDSQFSLDVPLNRFTEIGTNTGVASGSNTSVDWPDLGEQSEYEWYVTVTDPTDRMRVGPVWSFTTAMGNQPPVATGDLYSVDEDSVLNVDTASGVLVNDNDPEGDDMTAVLETDVSNGTLALADDGSFTYTPAPDFVGDDSFTYQAFDCADYSDAVTVTITVNNANNDPPTAVDDTPTTDEDSASTINVLANDSDPDPADTLTVTSASDGASGTTEVNLDNTITYTPNTNFNGTDQFTYSIDDGNGGTDSATVTIIVNAVNDDPVANDDVATTSEDTGTTIDVLGNDSDVDGDSLSVISVAQAANGSVVNTGADVTYTPNSNFFGSDAFTYTAGDGNGGTNSATVNVTVDSVNDAPTANNDSASTLRDVSVDIDVLSNDNDVEGDTLSVGSVTQPAHGSVVNNGTDVTYSPDPGYVGGDSFSYTANDGTANSNAATVTVTVNAPEPITLFSDGFESGSFTAGGWQTAGDASITTNSAYTGLYGAQLRYNATIEKAVNTVGYSAIHVKYARVTERLDSGEFLYVEWFDGAQWNQLEQTQATSWSVRDLGAAADNNAAFKLRFRTSADKVNEYGRIDDVEIIGTPAGPIDNPPSVSIINPADGATVSGSITVSADATDDDGVTQVEFFVDGSSIGVDNDGSNGWSANWDTTAQADGPHTVSATATDTAEQTGIDNIGVTVDNVDDAPTVSITNPTDGATVSGSVTVIADAGDDRRVSQVEFLVDGASIGVDTDGSNGWSANWDTTAEADGPHTVSATATDTASQTASHSISVTVNNTGPSTVHVESIAMSLIPAGKNWKGVAAVQISVYQANATVVGDWYLGGTGTTADKLLQSAATGVTDATGLAEVTCVPVKPKSGEYFTFKVTGVILTGYVFDAGQGVTENSIIVP
ncbi:MAG: tandem-95 repeat protein [Planctomycetes bacterium]|nr:tandem-95 repeat protein [Planctomycetota bacterium]